MHIRAEGIVLESAARGVCSCWFDALQLSLPGLTQMLPPPSALTHFIFKRCPADAGACQGHICIQWCRKQLVKELIGYKLLASKNPNQFDDANMSFCMFSTQIPSFGRLAGKAKYLKIILTVH